MIFSKIDDSFSYAVLAQKLVTHCRDELMRCLFNVSFFAVPYLFYDLTRKLTRQETQLEQVIIF